MREQCQTEKAKTMLQLTNSDFRHKLQVLKLENCIKSLVR